MKLSVPNELVPIVLSNSQLREIIFFVSFYGYPVINISEMAYAVVHSLFLNQHELNAYR